MPYLIWNTDRNTNTNKKKCGKRGKDAYTLGIRVSSNQESIIQLRFFILLRHRWQIFDSKNIFTISKIKTFPIVVHERSKKNVLISLSIGRIINYFFVWVENKRFSNWERKITRKKVRVVHFCYIEWWFLRFWFCSLLEAFSIKHVQLFLQSQQRRGVRQGKFLRVELNSFCQFHKGTNITHIRITQLQIQIFCTF